MRRLLWQAPLLKWTASAAMLNVVRNATMLRRNARGAEVLVNFGNEATGRDVFADPQKRRVTHYAAPPLAVTPAGSKQNADHDPPTEVLGHLPAKRLAWLAQAAVRFRPLNGVFSQ
jgi:hypothetical protein